MNSLWTAYIRGRIWRMILAMNEFAELNIKTPFGISNEFTCTEILKQGSVMASTLAALHVDSVHNYFQNENLGVYYGDVRVENLIFQDDIIRFENSENQLNTANIIFEIFQNINKMEFHPVKTKAMIINGNMENINLGKHIITYTDKMKYLGDIIHKSGKMDELIKERNFGEFENKLVGEYEAIVKAENPNFKIYDYPSTANPNPNVAHRDE